MKLKKSTTKIIITLSLALFFASPSFCLAVNNVPTLKNPFDNMQIPIPGMDKFQEASFDINTGSIKSTWIGEYIIGIYNFGIGLIGIIAMFAIAIGGTMWIISAGNPGRIKEAQAWIVGGLTGLGLGLGSYLILSLVNGDLVDFRPLEMNYIVDKFDSDGKGEQDGGNGGPGGPWSSKYDQSLNKINALNIYCPRITEQLENKSLDIKKSKIRAISESFRTKMVYRWNSKNGSGSDSKRGACPSNMISYDCSGFVRQVLWCAGFKSDPGQWTGAQLGGPKITGCTGDYVLFANGDKVKLQPGDLIGYVGRGDDRHVLIFTGTSFLDDSHGGATQPAVLSHGHYDNCAKIKALIKKGKPLQMRSIDKTNS